MSNYWKQKPELQLIDVSQDYLSISQQHCHRPSTRLGVSAFSPAYSADDWDGAWSENIGGDEFVSLEDFVDTNLDSDIIDFSVDEF